MTAYICNLKERWIYIISSVFHTNVVGNATSTYAKWLKKVNFFSLLHVSSFWFMLWPSFDSFSRLGNFRLFYFQKTILSKLLKMNLKTWDRCAWQKAPLWGYKPLWLLWGLPLKFYCESLRAITNFKNENQNFHHPIKLEIERK